MRLKHYIFTVLICICSQTLSASPSIQFWQTSSGARVYFVQNNELPILDISVEFAAGSSKDTSEKSGVANLTRHLLSLGAGGLSENEIANALADVGAQLGGNFDEDRASMTLRTLSSERERQPDRGVRSEEHTSELQSP